MLSTSDQLRLNCYCWEKTIPPSYPTKTQCSLTELEKVFNVLSLIHVYKHQKWCPWSVRKNDDAVDQKIWRFLATICKFLQFDNNNIERLWWNLAYNTNVQIDKNLLRCLQNKLMQSPQKSCFDSFCIFVWFGLWSMTVIDFFSLILCLFRCVHASL